LILANFIDFCQISLAYASSIFFLSSSS